MFSLAGLLAPLLGFYMKLGVLQALIPSGISYLVLAVFAMMMSLIGFYYRTIKVMLTPLPHPDAQPINAPADASCAGHQWRAAFGAVGIY
jgi:NADH-quinone oxidoreductase subunit N